MYGLMLDEATSSSFSKMLGGFITYKGAAHAQNTHHEERVVVAMATNYPPPSRCDVTDDRSATPVPQYT
jgi:hypothetical protein